MFTGDKNQLIAHSNLRPRLSHMQLDDWCRRKFFEIKATYNRSEDSYYNGYKSKLEGDEKESILMSENTTSSTRKYESASSPLWYWITCSLVCISKESNLKHGTTCTYRTKNNEKSIQFIINIHKKISNENSVCSEINAHTTFIHIQGYFESNSG